MMTRNIRNESGALSLDFIFALVLVLSMTFLLGVFSFSLSVVEGIQYLTFSSSRAYFAGHVSKQDQVKAGQSKFDELSKTGSYLKLLKKDWFTVTVEEIGDSRKVYEATEENDIFEGVRTKVVVGLLNQNLPLFGTTEGETPFITYMTSFLGREPSTEECMDNFVRHRFSELLKLGYSGSMDDSKYAKYDDNGC